MEIIKSFLLSHEELGTYILMVVCALTVVSIALIIHVSMKEKGERSSYEKAVVDRFYTFFEPQISEIINQCTSTWNWNYYKDKNSFWFCKWGEKEKIFWEFHCSKSMETCYFVINVSGVGEKALYRTNGASLELVRQESFSESDYMMVAIGFEMHNEYYLDKYNNLKKMLPCECVDYYVSCKHEKYVEWRLKNCYGN